ncbi:hypothetical protein [Rhodosalinus sediminis]|uniref:hypothetical protein n=1 Tax=Rhodosalinus sediminis TaxID=1940533 RepID=UPI002356E7AF|nr:hypothetical protein [Rhodosalinus sediminis]
MTRAISPEVQAAIEAGVLVPRDFLWIEARRRDTGAAVTWGAWSDLGTITADVIDPVSGVTVQRTYEGAGSLVQISEVPLVIGLTVQAVEIQLSQIADGAETLIRTYDARRAPVELHRGFLDPATMRLAAPAVPRFMGFVDEAPVETPAEGGEGAIRLTCTGHPQELVRSASAKRSDADQRRRNATDGFYRHAATVSSWKIFWGQKSE